MKTLQERTVTILTPTYNRANYLTKLFESLCAQTDKDFEWLIIDDGSTDNTEEIIKKIENNNADFTIRYFQKENGGKHTALNFSHAYLRTELTCIVDSDDYLTEDAIATIITTWEKYKKDNRICGITFLRGDHEGTPLGKIFPKSPYISNIITCRINQKIKGDCCEVIRTNVLKKYPFPVFNGEKFMGESYLWNQLGFDYNMVFINKVIYICEYLEGGLTRSGRKLRINCPKGGMENCRTYFIEKNGRKVNFITRIKEAWLIICYGKFAKLKFGEIVRFCGKKGLIFLNYPFGYILYLFWKFKYLR